MSGAAISPCRQICRLGPDRICDGCGRTIDEISVWYRLGATERAAVMARLADWRVRPEAHSPGQAQPRS